MNMFSLTKEDLIRLQEIFERQIKICETLAKQNNEKGIVDINLVRYNQWSNKFLERIDNAILKTMNEFEYEP